MTTMPVEAGFYVTSGFGPREGGEFHYGTDFGRDGGSGNHLVFAIRPGTVQYAGPASGFGEWVTIDHPADVGGGYSVYGHVIPEVAAGQWVGEGQRIARINPNPATNGGFPPHLHLEFHRFVWAPPGPDRIDPMSILAGAPYPDSGAVAAAASFGDPLFGVDVSEHQDGMSLQQAAREGISFAIIRTTDGTYQDRCYRSHLDDAEAAGMLTAAYHYLRNPSEGTSIQEQVDASLAVMGDAIRPMWLDVETEAGLSAEHIRAAKQCFEAAGVRVCGVYSYVPYWERRITEGEPDSGEFGALWVAAYGQNRQGDPSLIYPGNTHPQWDYPLGNQKPRIWQYGSNALVAGFAVDINAFRGTRDELRAIFYGGATPPNQPTKEDFLMALTDAEQRELLQLTRDIATQLQGPRQEDLPDGQKNPAGGRGWPQLGATPTGQYRTLVDGLSETQADVKALLAWAAAQSGTSIETIKNHYATTQEGK